MNPAPYWTVSQAVRLFTEQEQNENMAMVDMDNKLGAFWVNRYHLLRERGCPKVTAYDTVAVSARKSRRWVQDRVKVFDHYEAGELEEYSAVGITFLISALTREQPEAFIREAVIHPNTVLDTLLMEFPGAEAGEDDPRPSVDIPVYLFGINRRLANLPTLDRDSVAGHMTAIREIFERNGIE